MSRMASRVPRCILVLLIWLAPGILSQTTGKDDALGAGLEPQADMANQTEPYPDIYSTPRYPDVVLTQQNDPNSPSCRYWEGSKDFTTYKLTTCAYCYFYLFQTAELKPFRTYLVSINGSVFPHMTFIVPDTSNETIVTGICQTVGSRGRCQQWLDCCKAAEKCCERQQTLVAPPQSHCPSTWDGFACWDSVSAGRTEQKVCPAYLAYTTSSGNAHKTCTGNGTWLEKAGKEWTDYTTCYDFANFKNRLFIKIACDVLSLLALIPSLCIFLAYRQLRNQKRVLLHINLFSSFLAFAFFDIIWQTCVVYDRISNPKDAFVNSNSVACKFLYVLTRYTSSTNFMWMFCEGFYLHRLIVKAFQPPKRFFVFYILGWGLPWIPLITYSVIRVFVKNEGCWITNMDHYEWIIYVPNIVALAVNLAFLIDILRILLTQISSHPNEPSNYRRALKATFILVPLFGLQIFLVIYRPPLGSKGSHVFEIISAIIVNTQGFFVALIFCLINGEVLSNIRKTLNRYGLCISKRESRGPFSGATQTSDVYTTRESPTSSFRTSNSAGNGNNTYMAMKPMSQSNGHS